MLVALILNGKYTKIVSNAQDCNSEKIVAAQAGVAVLKFMKNHGKFVNETYFLFRSFSLLLFFFLMACFLYRRIV